MTDVLLGFIEAAKGAPYWMSRGRFTRDDVARVCRAKEAAEGSRLSTDEEIDEACAAVAVILEGGQGEAVH